MGDNQDKTILAELSRRIALFDSSETVGDCMGSCVGIYRQLSFWLVAGTATWFILAMVAR